MSDFYSWGRGFSLRAHHVNQILGGNFKRRELRPSYPGHKEKKDSKVLPRLRIQIAVEPMSIAKEELLTIATGLRYPKLERLEDWADNADHQVISDVIKSVIRAPYTILFFPGKCLQITPFGWSFTRFSTRESHYLLSQSALDEKFLRQAFTGLELVIYKICHIALEGQRSDYHFETQKLAPRFRRLRPLLNVPNWSDFEGLFDEISFVRNAFAHSFVPVEELLYCGVPLSACFGDSYLGRTSRDAEPLGARIFTDDLTELFSPVMDVFHKHQLEQIDEKKFERLCDRLLMKRSLSPRP
jgi:hypothetical protein